MSVKETSGDITRHSERGLTTSSNTTEISVKLAWSLFLTKPYYNLTLYIIVFCFVEKCVKR